MTHLIPTPDPAAKATTKAGMMINEVSKSALTRHDSAVLEELATHDVVIEQLRRAMVDELSALRCDIDILKQGGWKVAIGPFTQNMASGKEEDREEIRDAIFKRIDEKTAMAMPEAAKIEKSDAASNLASTKTTVASPPAVSKPTQAVQERFKPAFLRTLKPLTNVRFPGRASMVTFSWDFLTKMFHGAVEHSPGLYYMGKAVGGCILPSRTFYAISSEHETFLPTKPCEHGAKMTAFFNSEPPTDGGEPAYEGVPLFITSKDNPGQYMYYGTYSQPRWSDKVSYDVLAMHIPNSVKEYWAVQLADPARPAWVTRALMKHFFPMPEYLGPMPGNTPRGSIATATEEDEKIAKKVQQGVQEYVEDLALWEKDATMKVGLMSKETILKAFEKADADENPGLRLWWEYLECKQWDEEFYNFLVKEQVKLTAARR